jgi:hypothetical protein
MPLNKVFTSQSFFSSLLILFSILLVNTAYGQEERITTINGYAPAYVGKKMELYGIQDFYSNREELLASTVVKEDSTFTIYIFNSEIHKVILKSNNNNSYLYIQPDSKYTVLFPEKDKYEAVRPNGSFLELTFFGLDTLDINYKILRFNRWMDDYMSRIFYLKNANGIEFAQKLDVFKKNVEKYYKSDTLDYSSKFFETYVKYSIAALDDIQNIANRNRYEKHDFYLKHSKVEYNNDAYMSYLMNFYKSMKQFLSTETSSKVYNGILRSSPTLIMNALGLEYTLINVRIREAAMIQYLAEDFYSGELPQTNILTILDSVANHGLFESNSIIAKNTIFRLTELGPGVPAPNFSLTNASGTKVLKDYAGKYTYMHFFDPSSVDNRNEVQLLINYYKKYSEDVNFITVYRKKEKYSEEELKAITSIPWASFECDESNSIFKNYRIEAYPYYILLDPYAYVVAAPALGPTPNGVYETIDRLFYQIHRQNQQEKK